MSGLLSLGFGAPLALLALLALPALWWLLRVTPPRPKTVDFPPTALMRDLTPHEETPARTPWWLMALRLAVVALLALALARPILGPGGADDGRDGPLWLLVDDGWAAAPHWDAIVAEVSTRLDAAAARGRPVVLLGTAAGGEQLAEPQAVDDARRRLAVWKPMPWAETRDDLLAPLARSAEHRPPGSIVWVSHGLDLAAEPATRAFRTRLGEIARGAPSTLSLPAPLQIAVRVISGAGAGITAIRPLPVKHGSTFSAPLEAEP